MRYHPGRGGHAPGHLRTMFTEYVDLGEVPLDELYDPAVIGTRDPLQLPGCADLLCGFAGGVRENVKSRRDDLRRGVAEAPLPVRCPRCMSGARVSAGQRRGGHVWVL